MGAEAQKALIERKRKFLWDHKAEFGCVDCGERDPWVLDFDHVDPTTKNMHTYRSQRMYRKERRWFQLGWKALMAELEKCVVRCANCHRRRTAEQQGWRRY